MLFTALLITRQRSSLNRLNKDASHFQLRTMTKIGKALLGRRGRHEAGAH
jgi:hypothetical protein